MVKILADLHNALFFVHGKVERNLTIPAISGSETTPIKSEDCIVVFAQHAVDGKVSISMGVFIEVPDGLVEVFNEAININGHHLAVTNPEGDQILAFEMPKQYTSISIWVDRPQYPEIVKILIKT